jgi:hypothetical protein
LKMTTFDNWPDLWSDSMWSEAPFFVLRIDNTDSSTVVKSGKHSWQYFAPVIFRKMLTKSARQQQKDQCA